MNTNSPHPGLTDLRRLLQTKFPEAHTAGPVTEKPWQTRLPCLDAAGLYRGAITEVVGESRSCGAGLLMTALLEHHPQEVRQPVALVDACDAFDPGSVTEAVRERLLWLRCQGLTSAIRAADLLLRDGNIPLVLLDLQLCPSRQLLTQPSSIWHRLRFLTEKSGAALCVFTPCRVIACARSRLVLEHRFDLSETWQPRGDLIQRLHSHAERCTRLPAAATAPEMALAH